MKRGMMNSLGHLLLRVPVLRNHEPPDSPSINDGVSTLPLDRRDCLRVVHQILQVRIAPDFRVTDRMDHGATSGIPDRLRVAPERAGRMMPPAGAAKRGGVPALASGTRRSIVPASASIAILSPSRRSAIGPPDCRPRTD